jgi:hypothetical protein
MKFKKMKTTYQVQQSGQTRAVDWWMLGVLIHELLSGHAPFESHDAVETYRKIMRGEGDSYAVETSRGRLCTSGKL